MCLCAAAQSAPVAAQPAREPDLVEISQEKARLAASLFGGDTSSARSSRRMPTKQVSCRLSDEVQIPESLEPLPASHLKALR